jgi:RNA polymerase sigma-70 factor (ECF subfamily)
MQIQGEHGGEKEEADSEEESSFVNRAQQGDAAAFEQLYRGHVGRIFALCLRMTGDRELAEELTQSSFVRIWEQLGKFKQKSSFGTWSHRVALNVVLEYLRSMARRPTHVALLDEQAIRIDKTPSPGKRMDLEWAIRALPARARLVFVLHEIERLQHAEIAEMLGIAVGTSKAQLHRARKLLREYLE